MSSMPGQFSCKACILRATHTTTSVTFCATRPATHTDELATNPALTQDEQTYVTELLAGLSDYPAYYAHMGVINEAGPPPVDLSLPEPVNPDELLARIEAGEWVVDLRNRTAFAAGRLAGTRGFELSGSFVTYLGWLYDWGEPLTLIAENTDQIAQARRELVRIGIDELAGAAVGDVDNLSAGTELRSYRVGSFAELAEAMDSEDLTILDVRQHKEYETSHISGALNIPLHELIGRMSDVPEGEVWVHCASGYRSSIAASLIDRPGRTVVLVDDEYESAEKLQITG
jgi:rhodanese-related sulfurtransferase